MRKRPAVAVFGALACLCAAKISADPEPVAEFSVSGCRKAVVTEAESGLSLRGIEDIAVHPAADIAYLSVDDRWAVENHSAEGGSHPPQGGIYRLSLDQRSLQSNRLEVADLTASFKIENSLHPHGIDLVVEADGDGVLYVINRRDRPRSPNLASGEVSERGAVDPTVEVFNVEKAGALHHRQTVREQRLCRANEIAGLGPDRFLVSNDGASCGRWGRHLEQTLGLKRGNVVQVEIDSATGASTVIPIAQGIAFANGLAIDAQHVYVAATRDQALLVYRRNDVKRIGEREAPVRTIAIDGGPDNLSWASEHVLLVAVHPSLLRLGAYRYRWSSLLDTAPTRILEVNIRDGSQQILYANDEGEPLAAATIAVAHGGFLIAGSVTDEGLLLCDLGRPNG